MGEVLGEAADDGDEVVWLGVDDDVSACGVEVRVLCVYFELFEEGVVEQFADGGVGAGQRVTVLRPRRQRQAAPARVTNYYVAES